jgi:hypothetical protein
MFSKIVLLTILLTALSATANTLKTYDFTQNFISCLKDGSAKITRYEEVGQSSSSAITDSDFYNNYWQNMDCIRSTSSPVSSSNISERSSCSGFTIKGENKVRVRPALVQQKVHVGGYTLLCTTNGWDITEEPELNSSCTNKVIPQGHCDFPVEKATDGQLKRYVFDGLVDGKNYHGKLVTRCRDGNFEILEKNCKEVVCPTDTKVSWTDKSTGKTCIGKLDENGNAAAADTNNKLFSSLTDAKNNTYINYGSAKFACIHSQWRLLNGNCLTKAPKELICEKTISGLTTKYSCQ